MTTTPASTPESDEAYSARINEEAAALVSGLFDALDRADRTSSLAALSHVVAVVAAMSASPVQALAAFNKQLRERFKLARAHPVDSAKGSK